jgi:hypothetical protein
VTLSLVDKIVLIHEHLDTAALSHAFGGALALAFYTETPRATADIDCNVFLDAQHAKTAFAALPEGVSWTAADVDTVVRDGQVRVMFDSSPLDLFLDVAELHQYAKTTIRTVPFAGTEIPILSPTSLAVFKAMFDRPQDWVDLGAMAEVGHLDKVATSGWLVTILGAGDPRIGRIAAL